MSEKLPPPEKPGLSTNHDVKAWRACEIRAARYPLRVTWCDGDAMVTLADEDVPLRVKADDTLGEAAQRGVLPGQAITFIANGPCVVNVLALGRKHEPEKEEDDA